MKIIVIILIIVLLVLYFIGRKKNIPMTCGEGIGVIFLFFIILMLSLSLSTRSNKKSNSRSSFLTGFIYACEGDYWIIKDDNIAVSRNPKVSANEAQFTRNLVTVLGNGTKVEILKSKDTLSPWKYVYAYNTYNGQNKIYAKGWILAETVKRARRISKGTYCP